LLVLAFEATSFTLCLVLYVGKNIINKNRKKKKELLVVPTESQRMAARRALEWIGTLKARLVFRYEISDLLMYALLYIDKKNSHLFVTLR